MRITADTNILLRAALNDHPAQSPAAQKMLAEAERVVVTLSALCEFVWVTRRGMKVPAVDVASSLRFLLEAPNIDANRSAIMAGLTQMLAGGDFADAAIAHEGSQLGGEAFATFDKKAADLLSIAGTEVVFLDI